MPICQLHIDFISSPSSFHELNRWVRVIKSTLPSHQVHIKNLLSPCCQVHFAKSPSSYHQLVESMLSSPFCQVTKFVSWTHWVHIVKSTLPRHHICIINLLSPHCQVHVTNHQLHDIMTTFSCGNNIFLIYKLPNAWNCIPSLPKLLLGSQSTAPKENKIAHKKIKIHSQPDSEKGSTSNFSSKNINCSFKLERRTFKLTSKVFSLCPIFNKWCGI